MTPLARPPSSPRLLLQGRHGPLAHNRQVPGPGAGAWLRGVSRPGAGRPFPCRCGSGREGGRAGAAVEHGRSAEVRAGRRLACGRAACRWRTPAGGPTGPGRFDSDSYPARSAHGPGTTRCRPGGGGSPRTVRAGPGVPAQGVEHREADWAWAGGRCESCGGWRHSAACEGLPGTKRSWNAAGRRAGRGVWGVEAMAGAAGRAAVSDHGWARRQQHRARRKAPLLETSLTASPLLSILLRAAPRAPVIARAPRAAADALPAFRAACSAA